MREFVADLIRSRLGRKEAATRIAAWSREKINADDCEQFAKVVETELMSLHEGTFARYQVRPSEFAAWRMVWEAT